MLLIRISENIWLWDKSEACVISIPLSGEIVSDNPFYSIENKIKKPSFKSILVIFSFQRLRVLGQTDMPKRCIS